MQRRERESVVCVLERKRRGCVRWRESVESVLEGEREREGCVCVSERESVFTVQQLG